MHYCSLGSFCLSASILKRADLRIEALPFDWLFCAPRTAHAILSDKFEDLMNQKYHKALIDSTHHNSSHLLYDDGTANRPTFAHKDITTSEDFDYYARAIELFNIRAQEGLVLFLFEEWGEIFDWFQPLCEIIEKNFPNCRIFCVKHNFSDGNSKMILKEKNEFGQLWEFYGSKVIDGLQLGHASDEAMIVDHMRSAF